METARITQGVDDKAHFRLDRRHLNHDLTPVGLQLTTGGRSKPDRGFALPLDTLGPDAVMYNRAPAILAVRLDLTQNHHRIPYIFRQ